MRRVRVGADVGGTFTDVVVWDERGGGLTVLKTPSVPGDPAAGLAAAVERALREAGAAPADVGAFVGGATVAVNTVIQRAGARVALLVTRGFRDILTLRRVRLPGAPSYDADVPEPLVPRARVWEVGERLRADGAVLAGIPWDEVRRGVAELVGLDAEALAICFLHAYRVPRHEQAVAAWVRSAYPDLYVCASSEVWPQQREYERCAVTVLDAYVGPAVRGYCDGITRRLRGLGIAAPLFSAKSNGGVMSVEAARGAPAQTLLSGPASGVTGALYVAGLAGFDRIVTLDMGGTSADVAVVSGEIPYSTENTVGEVPVVLPSVDVTSVGAGGGSVLWVDGAGALRVGPESAGAVPGPACYGLGGARPAVTDCYVALGILGEHDFLGGRMPLRGDLAREALAALGARLGAGAEAVAAAALDAATATMHAALLPLLAGRGADRRDFALMAFGGAGPTHAFLLAEEAGFSRVLVPPSPGALCALGCLLSDFRADFVRTVYVAYHRARDDLAAAFEALDREAAAWLDRQGIPPAGRHLSRSADVRYRGQSYELATALPPGDARDAVAALPAAFERRYGGVYGYAHPAGELEVVNVRVQAVGAAAKPVWRPAAPRQAGRPEPAAVRAVGLRGLPEPVPVYRRSALCAGDRLTGPLIVTQYDTTVFVPPGFRVSVDPFLNLVGEQTA